MLKMLGAVAVLSALTLTSRAAFADESPPMPKDRGTAFALSAGGTALSAVLVMAGANSGNAPLVGAGLVGSLIAPSAGHIYAGKLGTPGLLLRLVSGGVAIAGLQEGLKCFGQSSPCDHDPRLAGELLVAAGIGYASGALLDIATAGRAVDDYNQRLQLRITPAVIPTASSGPAVGLGITGSF